MDFDLNKREFRDAVRLRYDWPIPDNPSVCVCGSMFTVDHAMICQRGGLVIQRHNEIRDLQAELLDMVCYDVEVEPALQPITGKYKYNSFIPLVFTTSGGMADERLRYHSRLAELLSAKKARELRLNNIMGQGESVLCNFAERAPMPKGIENPEKEELRC